MKIGIIGTGYVGLVSGICFADSGNQVLCMDKDLSKLELLESGKVPIYEPGLDILFERSSREKRIQFTSSLQEVVNDCSIIFLCLPTPPGEGGEADLSAVLSVVRQMGPLLSEYRVIVNKSTVPVGTADLVTQTLSQLTTVPFDVVSNPEFLREGVAVKDFMFPERVVIGSNSERATQMMINLYLPFVSDEKSILCMDVRSSELTKYAANSFLAMKITFMNEIANLCEKVGADIDQIRRGIGSDSRIGAAFLYAGLGYGGSCFPKDVQALCAFSEKNESTCEILETVERVNKKQRILFANKILTFFENNLKGKRIGLWGLAFKPDTDDVREAPAIELASYLVANGAHVLAYDPEAIETFQRAISPELKSQIEFVRDKESAIEKVDAVVICTEWNEFRNYDFKLFHDKMNQPVMFDGRNMFSIKHVKKSGITYFSVGRKPVLPS